MSAGPACRHLAQKEIDEYYSDKTETQKQAEWVKKCINEDMKYQPETRISTYLGAPLTEDNFTFQDLLNILTLENSKRKRYGLEL